MQKSMANALMAVLIIMVDGHLARASEPVRIDAEVLSKISPRARADVLEAIVSHWNLAQDADINNVDRQVEFLAEMATETGGFVVLSENMNYSAERLRQVFPNRVAADDAKRLEHRPIATANHVYGGRLGNTEPNDGWLFRGAGLLQLTGRSNFTARGKELSMPLGDHPELVRSAFGAFSAAVAYWKARRINEIADHGSPEDVRRAVNGGLNGMAAARIWLKRTRIALTGGQERETLADQLSDIISALSEAGFPVAVQGERSAATIADTLVEFQRSRGLPDTGEFDEDTLYELTSPVNFESGRN